MNQKKILESVGIAGIAAVASGYKKIIPNDPLPSG